MKRTFMPMRNTGKTRRLMQMSLHMQHRALYHSMYAAERLRAEYNMHISTNIDVKNCWQAIIALRHDVQEIKDKLKNGQTG